MSRPSSYHAAPPHGVDDDFTLPLFQQPASSSLAYQPHPFQAPPLNPAAPPPRSPARTSALPPPPTGHAQQTPQRHSVHSHLTPTRAPGSPYSPQAYTSTSASNTANGSATSSQRQSMHFPAYTSGGYSGEQASAGGAAAAAGGASGGTLGSLARSASLSTARRKDPFSYPSDDVESGMAGGDMSGPGYSASSGTQLRPGGGGGAASQMPMPYLNTNLRSDNDVVMSPPSSSGNNASRYSHSQHSSMPPPPIPRLQAATSPTLTSQQPSNPYVPRDGPPSDSWLHYRRSSARQSHSPQSGSVSPALVASPHSPSMMQETSSPHLLTPQGTLSNLPSSPRTGSGPRDNSHGFYHPPPTTHRSHSQSFVMGSHSNTPSSGRYADPHQSRSNSRDGPTSRQGLRPVRDWNDLKPRLNSHQPGRRADPDVPGAYLSVSCGAAPVPCFPAHSQATQVSHGCASPDLLAVQPCFQIRELG